MVTAVSQKVLSLSTGLNGLCGYLCWVYARVEWRHVLRFMWKLTWKSFELQWAPAFMFLHFCCCRGAGPAQQPLKQSGVTKALAKVAAAQKMYPQQQTEMCFRIRNGRFGHRNGRLGTRNGRFGTRNSNFGIPSDRFSTRNDCFGLHIKIQFSVGEAASQAPAAKIIYL